MTGVHDVELARLFLCAERSRLCLVPSSPRIRELLRRQIDQGKAIRPVRGLYARASYWRALAKPQQTIHILRTLQKLHPDWVLCHESAAIAFGLPVSFDRMDAIHVETSRAKRNASPSSIRWHVIEDDDPVLVQSLRVTSLTRTVFDCMRTSSFKQALAIADGALRCTGNPPGWFAARFKRLGKTHPGINQAIRTMYYADPLSESGGESMARAAMIEQGFALPYLQVAFPQPLDPQRSYRVDFLWTRMDGSNVIGEFDGMQKYECDAFRNGRTPLRVLADERHRESHLTLHGMPIVRFSYKDVMDADHFARLLECYGIPRNDEIARTERRLARTKSRAAQLFTIESLPGEQRNRPSHPARRP